MNCARMGPLLLASLGVLQAGTAFGTGAERNMESPMDDARAAPIAVQKGSWVFVPIPVSNPTLGTGLQAAVLRLWAKRPGEEDAPGTTSGAVAMATDTDSWLVGAFHDTNFRNDRFRLSAFAGFGQFNLSFYGTGDSPELSAHPVPYQFRGSVAQVRGDVRVPGTRHWFVGLSYLIMDASATFSLSQAVAGLPELQGDFRSASLGPQVTYDSRDSNYFPKEGQYARASWRNYSPTWGGNLSYDKVDFFYNTYIPVASHAVLALRARLQGAGAGTPFFDLPTLDMRGFARDRYRDERTASVTAEGRYILASAPRWGVVAFVEAGRFAPTMAAMSDAPTITSYGGGLRWQVTADQPMHIGLDFARSTDDSAVFIQIGENF